MNIVLDSSNWNIFGLNVMIEGSHLQEKVKLAVGNVKNTNKRMIFLNITNSKFYQITVKDGYIVTISRCEFDKSANFESNIIEIENSELNIKNSSFIGIKASNNVQTILSAVSSGVSLNNVQCSGIEAEISLIQITNGSKLHVKSSNFTDNRMYFPIIVAKFQSRVNITESTFSDNVAMYGSCIMASTNSTLTVHNSIFLKNEAFKGGAIIYHDTLYLEELYDRQGKNYKFEQGVFQTWRKNNKQRHIKEANKRYFQQKSEIKSYTVGFTAFFINSYFINNTAWEGGDIHVTGDLIDIFIFKCYFDSFANLRGGSVFVNGTTVMRTSVHVTDSNFDMSLEISTGPLHVENTFLKIASSEIGTSFSANFGAGILATKNSIVDVVDSVFACFIPVMRAIDIYQNVTLNITRSTFLLNPVTEIPLIKARRNCSITVLQSSVINNSTPPAHVVIFDIGVFSNLTVNDTKFISPIGLGLTVLSATNQSSALFTNCSFKNVSGFTAYNKSSLYIERSIITGCINTVLTNGFIEVSQSSELQIVDSNITDNRVLETSTLIYVSSKSTLKIRNSLYARNNMARLIAVEDSSNVFLENNTFINNRVIESNVKSKALVDSNGGNVDISHCYFFKNVVSAKSSSMLLMINSNVLILKSKMIKNTINGYVDGTILIKIDSSYATNITNSIFKHNLFNAVFSVRSPSADSKSFLLIQKSSFILNFLDSIFTENVQDILIRKVLSRVIPELEVQRAQYGIFIRNTKSLRIKESVFNATSDWPVQIYFGQTYFQTMLFTMESVFFDDNSTLTTNSSNFLRRATSIGYIQPDIIPTVQQQESSYAWSKY